MSRVGEPERATARNPPAPFELEHPLGDRRAEGARQVVSLLAPIDLVSGFHAAMFVSAGAFLAGAIATLVAVERLPEPVTA